MRAHCTHEEANVIIECHSRQFFELVEKFCYLGDMLCAGGGAEEASRTRVRSAWGKFNELAPVCLFDGEKYMMPSESVGIW